MDRTIPKTYMKIPDGWKVIRGATTAPHGHVWIFNGKPLFSDEYEHALLVVS